MVVGQAEEPTSNYEHLKPYDALLGCWILDGEALEDVPDVVERGTKMVFHCSHKWILNKSALEFNGRVKFGDAPAIKTKALITWDRANKRIVSASVSSNGAIGLGTITISEDGKTWTSEVKSVNPEGQQESSTTVLTLVNADTWTWQATSRTGGPLTGESPKYTVKRCKGEHDDDDDDDDEDNDDEDDDD
jgi:hypothetical protein